MPFIPVYLPDGDFAGVAGSNFNFNIAGMLAQAGRTKNVYDDIWYTGSFKLTPFKGLTVRGDYTGNRYFRTTRAHEKTIYQKQPDGTSMSKGDPNGVSLKKYDDTYEALNLWAEYKNLSVTTLSLQWLVITKNPKKPAICMVRQPACL